MMKLGYYFLGAWLILHGLQKLIDISFKYDDMLMGILALVAGILVIIRK